MTSTISEFVWPRPALADCIAMAPLKGLTTPSEEPHLASQMLAGGQQGRPADPPDRLGNLGRVGARWLHCASPNISSRKRSYPRNARGVGCPFGSNVTCNEADGEDP
jgi:hypothetical protein